MPEKPILLFDGDCGFCRRWIGRWKTLTGGAVLYFPYQGKLHEFPGITEEDCRKSVQLIEPGGLRTRGAEAVFRVLNYAPSRRWLLAFYQKVPGFALVTEWFYALVAGNRTFFSKLTRLFSKK